MAEDRYALLERPRHIWRSERAKIQRVAHHQRNRIDFAKYYSPKLVSLGPIHHGEPHLELGEQYKLTWASIFVEGDRNTAQRLHKRVILHIKELKDLYTHDAIRQFNDDELAWMLFVDGCALFQILMNSNTTDDPQKLSHVRVDLVTLIRQDALLLENQLPFLLLQILSPYEDDSKILYHMVNFLHFHFSSEKSSPPPPVLIRVHDFPLPPAHLLEELRRQVLRDFRQGQRESFKKGKTTYRNLKELKAAGIEVKRSVSKCPLDITFSSYSFGGELWLPEILGEEDIARTLLNLTALEMCPDFDGEHEISSYVEFLDCLIDHPDDVKELRRAHILPNDLGSDEEVAKLFNVIGTELVPNAAIYAPLKHAIEKHYQRKRMTWFALAHNTYFSNPWSIIAISAASLILILTFIQTWFAAFPRHSNYIML